MGLTAQAIAALDAGGTPLAIAEIDLPDGSTLRVGSFGGFHGDRRIKPFVPQWPRFSYGSEDREGRVESTRVSLSVNDPVGELVMVLRGENGRNIAGSAVRVLGVLRGLSSDHDIPLFTGVVIKYGTRPPNVVDFTLKLDLEELRGDGHRTIVNANDFPTAPDDSVGETIPVVLGVHDSTGTDATGMLSTVRVSTSGDPFDSSKPYRYVVSEGRLPDVFKRWTDGASPTTLGNLGVDWFWTLRNGKVFTEVGFSSDPGASAVITVDAYGLASVAVPTADPSDASAVVRNPVDALQLYLTNWVFNRWNDGSNRQSWFDPFADTPLEQASWNTASAFFGRKGAASKRSIPAQSVEATLAEWFDSVFAGFYLQEEGKLGLWINDMHTSKDAIYPSALYRHTDLVGEFPPMEQDSESAVSRVRYRTNLVEATGDYLDPRTTADPHRATSREADVSMPWSGSAA